MPKLELINLDKMESWSSFIITLLWIILVILVYNNDNFISIILFSELVWVTLYSLCTILGIINDDLVIMSLTFICLGLAGLEFSVGVLLVALFKSNTGSVILSKGK